MDIIIRMIGANNQEKIEKPIFVFGCCNSGTTILWGALKSHGDLSGPDVEGQDLEGLPESMKHHLGNVTFRMWAHHLFAQGDEKGIYGSNLVYYVTEDNFKEEDRYRVVNTYNRFTEPGKRFISKSPADTLRARLIQSYFPDSYFVAVVRNGYAVSEGIVRKREFDPERLQFKGLKTTIDDAAEQWNNSNRVISSYQELDLLERLMIVKYEDLVENPKDTLFSVLDFCGLSKDRIIIPIFDRTLNRQQISRLSDHDVGTITRIAQPMLDRFGYGIL